METLIRRMKVDDIPMLQQVAKTTWNTTYEGMIPLHIQEAFLERNYSDTALKNRMERSIVYVAEIDGEIKGYANFFRSKQNAEEAELGAIYVLPEMQSKGIGSHLLHAGMNELTGVKRLFVAVEKENAIGKRFYHSRGFVPIDEIAEQVDGHTINLLKMVLHLPVIRKFNFSDIDAITELMDDLGHPATKEQMLKRMENISSNPMYCTFVAEYEGNVVGMVGVRQLFSYEGDDVVVQISALVTNAKYRRLGIGNKLVNQAEKWAKENGANVIILTSGNRPERENAHGFYKHLGFQVTGLRFVKRI